MTYKNPAFSSENADNSSERPTTGLVVAFIMSGGL